MQDLQSTLAVSVAAILLNMYLRLIHIHLEKIRKKGKILSFLELTGMIVSCGSYVKIQVECDVYAVY